MYLPPYLNYSNFPCEQFLSPMFQAQHAQPYLQCVMNPVQSPAAIPSFADIVSRPPVQCAEKTTVCQMPTRDTDAKFDCLVYIDNSNMFCEGKKFYSKHQNLYVEEDRRFRIRFGEFIDLVIGEHHPLAAKLYFSNPSENGELWDALEQKVTEYVHAERFRKNIFGKEKEVDNSITADIVDDLWTTESVSSRVFVIVSGDSDFLPALKKVLRNGCHAEVYSYTQSLAKRLKQLEPAYPEQLKIFDVGQLLIDHKCYFLEYQWSVYCKHVKDRVWIPKHKTIVFGFKQAPTEQQIHCVLDRCTELIKYPCLYQSWDDLHVMVVVGGSADEVKISDVENALAVFKEEFARVNVPRRLEVCSMKQFLEKLSKKEIENSRFSFGNRYAELNDSSSDCELEPGDQEEENSYERNLRSTTETDGDEWLHPNRYHLTDCDDSSVVEASIGEVSDGFSLSPTSQLAEASSRTTVPVETLHSDDSGFTKVQSTRTKKSKVRDCKYGFSCLNGVHCANIHTDQECRFFRVHRAGKPNYKSKPCMNRNCEFKSDPSSCPFAHTLRDARCYKCRQNGTHWQDNCVRGSK